MLRTLVRDKGNLVAESGDWVRRMQKSLDQMNVRVHRAVSDINGVTGMAIMRAIASGRAGCSEAGEIAGSPLPQERGRDRRTVKRALARRPLVQLVTGVEDVRRHCRRITAYEKEILRKLAAMEQEEHRGQTAPP